VKKPGEEDAAGKAQPAGDRWPTPEALEAYLAAGGKLTPRVPLLNAHPYRVFSGQPLRPGKIHLIDPERAQTTICGKKLQFCPGEQFQGDLNQITCLGCRQALEKRAERRHEEQEAEKRRQQFEAEQKLRDEEFARRGREWQDAKTEYHRSYVWQEKRRIVFARAARTGGTDRYGNALCEGCHKRPAQVVHHITYPPNVLPGSQDWISREMDYQLKALCHECHENMTGIRYPYYG
jgi:hypothetical protein